LDNSKRILCSMVELRDKLLTLPFDFLTLLVTGLKLAVRLCQSFTDLMELSYPKVIILQTAASTERGRALSKYAAGFSDVPTEKPCKRQRQQKRSCSQCPPRIERLPKRCFDDLLWNVGREEPSGQIAVSVSDKNRYSF
jgi:hypothetical protein